MKTILFVDDEPDILELFDLLKEEGFRSLTANGPMQALDIISKEKVDMVVSDIKMPGMTGVEFMQKVQRNPPSTGLPKFILFSGHLDEDSQALIEKGAYCVLSKPDGLIDLPEKIRNVFFPETPSIDENEELDDDDLGNTG